jgi:hypothetical protein
VPSPAFVQEKPHAAGFTRGLTVTPTANDTNAPITVRDASGALGSVPPVTLRLAVRTAQTGVSALRNLRSAFFDAA